MIALVLAWMAAVSVVACGGGEPPSPREVVADLRPVRSAQVAAVLEIRLDDQPDPALRTPLRVSLEGPFVSNGPRRLPSLDWGAGVTVLGEQFLSQVVLTGDNAYIQLGGAPFELGEANLAQVNAQVERTAQEAPRGFASLGIDPLDAVRAVRAAGRGRVAGAPTTRYTGTLEMTRVVDIVARLLERTPIQPVVSGQPVTRPRIAPRTRERILSIVADPTFELHVAADKTLRRLSLRAPFRTPREFLDTGERVAQGIRQGVITYDVEYGLVGEPLEVIAPEGARPIEDFVRELRSEIRRRGGILPRGAR